MANQPNIILLVMDSVRAANLSCYGYDKPTTPNIDALAAEGTLFTQAISIGCWTLPVHTSLFTGLYPLNHGVTISRSALPTNFPTLSRQLEELGYQTACFSNNAYISAATGLTQGFDTVENVWQVSKPRGTKRTKMSRLVKQLERLGPAAKPVISAVRSVQRTYAITKRLRSRQDSGAATTNERIKTWLTGSRKSDKPFFIFVNYMEPHEPYNPPHPYNQRFMPKGVSPWRIARVGNNKDVAYKLENGRSRNDLDIIEALYNGEISYLDEKIGELARFIASLGILDDTVLIVTSDHGDSLGEHNLIGHRMALYEQLVHVPLIVRYPAHFKPGARITQQVSLIDLYPTLLDLAGVDLTENRNGFYSLLSLPVPEKRSFVVAENTAPKSLNSMKSEMVRTGQYKYIRNGNQQHELYDLVKDPHETINLVATEPGVARQLQQQLEEWQRQVEVHQIESNQGVEYDEVILERLRDLGYVE